MNDSVKTIMAMIVGALTSLGASMTSAIKGYSLKLLVSAPILSLDYLGMLFTAFMLGIMGALGGLVVREAYKLIIDTFFPGMKKHKDHEEE